MTNFDSSGSLHQMQLFPVVEVVSDDIPMGVLNDGNAIPNALWASEAMRH